MTGTSERGKSRIRKTPGIPSGQRDHDRADERGKVVPRRLLRRSEFLARIDRVAGLPEFTLHMFDIESESLDSSLLLGRKLAFPLLGDGQDLRGLAVPVFSLLLPFVDLFQGDRLRS
jgi:hypothetical protein